MWGRKRRRAGRTLITARGDDSGTDPDIDEEDLGEPAPKEEGKPEPGVADHPAGEDEERRSE